MLLNDREQILAMTAAWTGERYPNGRPKVSDEKIEILKTLTQEEIWQPLYSCGYRFQFQGNLQSLHPGKKLYGRAVTCCFMPQRPDSAPLLYLEGIPLAQVMTQRRQHEIQRLLRLFPQGCRLVQHQHGMVPHVALGVKTWILRNANQRLHLREPVVQLVHFPQHLEKHRRVLPFQQRLF